MTTTVSENPTAASAPSSRPVLFGRAVAFEWTKLVGVRATVVNGVFAVLGTIGLAALFGVSIRLSGQNGYADPTPAAMMGFQSMIMIQALVIAIITLFCTSEYATGSIRTTLQAVPRRGRMLLAKAVIGFGVGVVSGLVLTPIGSVAGGIAGGGEWAPLDGSSVWEATLGTATFLGLLGLVVVGLAVALRSTAGSLVSLFVLMYVVPQVLPAFGVDWITTATDYLPFTAFAVLGTGSSEPYGWPIALVTMAGWALVSMLVGAWLLHRRDAR